MHAMMRNRLSSVAFTARPIISKRLMNPLMATVASDPFSTADAVDNAPVIKATGSDVRVRFAPSPTGTLHVGGARTALFNYLKARNEGGKFVLRIEDTDEARSTRESEEGMLNDLRWLGLDWDEGPDVGGDKGPYRQSERGQIYKDMAKKLVEAGHAYPCFCTEEELDAKRQQAEAEGRAPQYDGTWRDADPEEVQRRLDAGEPHTMRFKVPQGKVVVIQDEVRGRVAWDAEATVGDFILLRSSGVPVYNFCVAVDDAMMGITHVIRAEEHLTNTLRQCLILDALDMPRPTYAHCSLILGEDRSKLSKRHGATSVDQFKQQGFSKDAMVNYLSLLGWNDGTDQEIYTREELEGGFKLDRIVKSAAVFDMLKLKWMNGQHLRALPVEELEPMVGPALKEAGVTQSDTGPFVQVAVELSQPSMELVGDAVELTRTMLDYPLEKVVQSGEAAELLEDGFVEVAQALIKAHAEGEIPSASDEEFPQKWKKFVKAMGKELGRKGKRLFHPIRLAVTGSMSGPDIGGQLSLLCKAESEGIKHVSLDSRIASLQKFVESA
eukprot:CAMPEP_0113938446 /NCGR_PEP_ID=MMETSP1339-20121228/4869_1 /TAXON_ID=94617 /ORGANISM="Fibrocapsa japonica" /LENGTH=552 /DNA_ID=CAMNT_0000941569 /DNA_START=247 /DNA_END=1905 /DNA_ORIENTATION=- /assembly_acc=CAM_ASM_000762